MILMDAIRDAVPNATRAQSEAFGKYHPLKTGIDLPDHAIPLCHKAMI